MKKGRRERVEAWLNAVEQRSEGEEFDNELAAKGEELLIEALSEAWFGYKAHKWAIGIAATGSFLAWAASCIFLLITVGDIVGEGGVMPGLVISLGLFVFACLLLGAAIGLTFLLYQRLFAMGVGKAVDLAEHMLVHVFGVDPNNRFMRWGVRRLASWGVNSHVNMEKKIERAPDV